MATILVFVERHDTSDQVSSALSTSDQQDTKWPRLYQHSGCTWCKNHNDSNQNIMVITCDQQLYSVVFDLTFHTPALLSEVVAVLGGMHFRMDFVGCLWLLTAENDTKAIISTTFGSVDKMLSGKKYPQNVRALRLLTEEILRPVFHRYVDRLLSMADLEAMLTELSGKSRTTKMWVDLIIKPTFMMMQFSRTSHKATGHSTW